MAVTMVNFRPLSTSTASIPPHFLSSAAHTALLTLPTRLTPFPTFSNSATCFSLSCNLQSTKAFAVPRRSAMALVLSSCIFSQIEGNVVFAQQSVVFREYIDTFDGYSFNYPKNWIQVRGANADIFFRDPFILDENISVEVSSPSSSKYQSVEDLGPPEVAGKAVLRQYLTEFMSTRLGVNIKSYANNNELAVMPQDRVARKEWDRRYLSVLGVENNQLYELRLQVPENVFIEEENDIHKIMDSFRVNKISV
ncbi:Mog1/PsbP, alpha/beta/alpha sandwich [Cynara cardunculus var. scolymus]|uniref:Mog1/PsbP, alpha/beta/alpha sandwich n=1 Tax=Cynara cardunculus var. scolymus TaxID=59895 RepID=A0A103Y307_CYNCS|nr:Mog1/PsbP, alpha/beta/alpha sandwich [Cynara cardunculus var. scolymus]